jgi:predicted anti-sigma-YlaC factor YlaD
MYYYLDGEITRENKSRIERHLRQCQSCPGAFSFERHLKEVLRDRLQEEPKPEVIDRLRAVLREEGFGG